MGMPTVKSVICTETELKFHRVVYNWEINNWDRICTPDTEEFEPIHSTSFKAGNEVNRESEWDAVVSCSEGYLQIWIYLKKTRNDIENITVNLLVRIMRPDGTCALLRRCDKNQSFTSGDNGWGMGQIVAIADLWRGKGQYLVDNKLRLQLQLDILGDFISRVKKPNAATMFAIDVSSGLTKATQGKTTESDADQKLTDIFETVGYDCLKRDMKKLFQRRRDTDFTILCGQHSFPVHKLIFSARSKVFAAMFQHDTTECRSNTVTIEDIPPATVERLIEYVYTGTVKLPAVIDELISLVQASDKYELEELKNRCLRTLCIQINQENVGTIAIIAYLHNAELFIQEEIRQYCQSHWDVLMKSKSFKKSLISTPRAFFDDLKSLSEFD